MGDLFHNFVYVPLYNALIGILSLSPLIDVGVAVILLTILVKLVLFPLSLKAARTQLLMRELEGPMKEIKEKYKNSKEEQGRKMLELYREKGVNPLSGIFSLFVQLPVIFGLYFVFFKGGLPTIDLESLYTFITAPQSVNMMFLGIVDMGGKSATLAVLAGVSQYWQAYFALPPAAARSENASSQEDFTRAMNIQMRYVLPIFIVFVAYVASAAVALYWIASNIFMIGQELYVRRRTGAPPSTTPHVK